MYSDDACTILTEWLRVCDTDELASVFEHVFGYSVDVECNAYSTIFKCVPIPRQCGDVLSTPENEKYLILPNIT